MPNRYYSSTSVTTALTGTVGPSTTSITLASTVGMPGSLPYTLILDPDTLVEEIVTVTGASGTTLTVTRGQDGTTGQNHTAGAVVVHGVSARDFREPQAHMDLTADVHGVTGALASAASVTALSTSTSGSLGGKVDKSTLAGKGYLVTATTGSTPAGLAPGADGTVLTCRQCTQTNGIKWGTAPGIELLAKVKYAPADTVYNPANLYPTFASIDSTNLAVTFTAPASGQVLVRMWVLMGGPGGTTTPEYLCLRSAGATVSGTAALVAGTKVIAGAGCTVTGTGYIPRAWLVSGLTSGTSYTYSLGYAKDTSGNGNIFVGSTLAPPFLAEVWSA
jgi:hypothetical protein